MSSSEVLKSILVKETRIQCPDDKKKKKKQTLTFYNIKHVKWDVKAYPNIGPPCEVNDSHLWIEPPPPVTNHRKSKKEKEPKTLLTFSAKKRLKKKKREASSDQETHDDSERGLSDQETHDDSDTDGQGAENVLEDENHGIELNGQASTDNAYSISPEINAKIDECKIDESRVNCAGCDALISPIFECPYCLEESRLSSARSRSFYCNKDCFRLAWSHHKIQHPNIMKKKASGTSDNEKKSTIDTHPPINAITAAIKATGSSSPSARADQGEAKQPRSSWKSGFLTETRHSAPSRPLAASSPAPSVSAPTPVVSKPTSSANTVSAATGAACSVTSAICTPPAVCGVASDVASPCLERACVDENAARGPAASLPLYPVMHCFPAAALPEHQSLHPSHSPQSPSLRCMGFSWRDIMYLWGSVHMLLDALLRHTWHSSLGYSQREYLSGVWTRCAVVLSLIHDKIITHNTTAHQEVMCKVRYGVGALCGVLALPLVLPLTAVLSNPHRTLSQNNTLTNTSTINTLTSTGTDTGTDLKPSCRDKGWQSDGCDGISGACAGPGVHDSASAGGSLEGVAAAMTHAARDMHFTHCVHTTHTSTTTDIHTNTNTNIDQNSVYTRILRKFRTLELHEL